MGTLYIIQRVLAVGNIPSRLEPSGLYRSDGKHPEGITVAPPAGKELEVAHLYGKQHVLTHLPHRTSTQQLIKDAGLVAEIAETHA